MKITTIETYTVPLHVSTNDWCIGKPWVFVKVETDADITGWGESHIMDEQEQHTANLVQELAKYLEGMNPSQVRTLSSFSRERIAGAFEGIELSSAIAGVEIALWDIIGKKQGKPVYGLFGKPYRDKVRVYANCWSHEVKTPSQLAEYAQEQVAHGFKVVKVYPFLYTDDVEDGVARLQAVREAVGDEIEILVDAWFSVDLGDIARIADALHEFNVEWFEDPVSPKDIQLLTEIKQGSDLKIVSGETLSRKQEFKRLLRNGNADILNPDIACCGIQKIKKIAIMAENYDVKMAIHNYNSMSIGLAASLHVAALIPNFTMVEYFQRFDKATSFFSSHPYTLDAEGCITLGYKPGLGITIDEEALQDISYKP